LAADPTLEEFESKIYFEQPFSFQSDENLQLFVEKLQLSALVFKTDDSANCEIY